MITLNRAVLGAAVLLLSNLQAIACGKFGTEQNWYISRPGGLYGVFQYHTGPGPFDAHTALLLGSRIVDIPVPLYALMAAAAILGIGMIARMSWRFCPRDPQASNQPAVGEARLRSRSMPDVSGASIL